jgi:CubicO group peptidase (beta-lactamase class C family)
MLATPSVTLVGVAGVFTTVRDLAKWDQNFYDAAVGGRELIAQIQKPGTLHQGQPLEYAFGLYVRTLGGLRIQEHGGDLGGYRTWMKRVPEQRFSVICLCNLTSILQGNIASYVTNIYLATGGPTSGPVAVQPGNIQQQRPPAALGPSSSRLRLEDLSEYAGEYYSEELDASYIVTAEEGRLFYQVRRMPRTQLAADQQKDVFRAGTLALTFSRNPARQIVGFMLDADRTRNLRFMKRHP